MFSPLCRRLAALTFVACFALPAQAAPAVGDIASAQARYLATHFPGRMTGSPAEMLAADYVRQQFTQMGYQSDIRAFHARYLYIGRNNHNSWYNVTGSMAIAAHQGRARQQIILMAHLDTYAPRSDEDTENNLGGLALQGIDDNALGVGVMLELAQRLQGVKTQYAIRFIATSGEEEGSLGATDLLRRMDADQQKNTLLVINLDNLVVGDKLYFNSGRSTPVPVRKLTRDRALAIARALGIAAATNPGLNPDYPHGTGCCNDAVVFDNAAIPVLSIEATNWLLGNKDGYQQLAKSPAFPNGTSWHNVQLDNQQHIDKALPGRIERRSREVVRVMLPLLKELAKAEKQESATKFPAPF